MALKRSISVVAALCDRRHGWLTIIIAHKVLVQCPLQLLWWRVKDKARSNGCTRSPLVQYREKRRLTFLQTSLVSLCAKIVLFPFAKKWHCFSLCKGLFDFCTRFTVRAVSGLERGSTEETGQDWTLAAFDHLIMDNDDN